MMRRVDRINFIAVGALLAASATRIDVRRFGFRPKSCGNGDIPRRRGLVRAIHIFRTGDRIGGL
jgi:hypothetical protein